MNQEDRYWSLKNHKLFEQFNKTELEILSNISTKMKTAKKNEIINFSDTDSKRVYIIKAGTIKICKEDSNGKEVISELLQEGDIFGHLQIKNSSHLEYAKVLSDELNVCYFEYSNFIEILKNNPALSIKFNNNMSEKLFSFQQKYEDLIFKNVDKRVMDFFKRYAKHHGAYNGSLVEMEMMLTHQDIAAYVASSRQSVTSVINKLIKDGHIKYEGRKKVIIPDVTNLK